MRQSILIVLVLAACAPLRPRPPLPPPDGPGDCATAEARLRELGGCGLDIATFSDDCRDATEAEVEVGLRFPAGCLTAAASCDEAELCR